MAIDKQFIKENYPLPVYNYRVTVLDSAGAVQISFAEISGLQVEYEPVTYKHGLSYLMGDKIIPGMQQPINITMKKGIVKSQDLLQKWIDEAYNNPFGENGKRDVLIELCDENADTVLSWKVEKALPTKLEVPSFDANSNEVAIETMELLAHDLKVNNVSSI
ncbi:MAG: phage tail protein [Calditrichaeota bacterium]|nr:MAG: phage tail protein [Calditrichota bacterium]